MDGVQNASSNPLILLCECNEGKREISYMYMHTTSISTVSISLLL